jgi:hypothetical protein
MASGPPRAALLLAPALLSAAPALAQPRFEPTPEQKAEAMVARQREMLGLRRTQARCAPRTSADEIVVCATDTAKYRVQSTAELNPTSRQATRTGVPRAPDVGNHPRAGVGVGGCMLGPCPPPTMYMIDLATIPEAPPGSDADKIAKGEMRGR